MSQSNRSKAKKEWKPHSVSISHPLRNLVKCTLSNYIKIIGQSVIVQFELCRINKTISMDTMNPSLKKRHNFIILTPFILK